MNHTNAHHFTSHRGLHGCFAWDLDYDASRLLARTGIADAVPAVAESDAACAFFAIPSTAETVEPEIVAAVTL